MPALVSAQQNFNRQCIHAAYSSRLDPYALQPSERRIFHTRLDEHHAKLYLSLRNAILRLWTRNPLLSVVREEATKCSKDRKYQRLALVAWEWLSKNGYINFGCIDHPSVGRFLHPAQTWKQKTIVIIGAGVAGLVCARQLYGLFHQFNDQWGSRHERLPRVIVLEGRNRVGGRVYSHPLRRQSQNALPHNLSSTVELGAQIITGFDHGNPLDAVVRGQLALEYHLMTDNMTLYDYDGTIVNADIDKNMEELFNDIQEFASDHPLNWKPAVKISTPNGVRTTLAPANEDAQPQQPGLFPGLANGITPKGNMNGEPSPPSLGTLMDQLVSKYQRERNLSAQDMRILNWHFAHLEYGNAVNVSQLSLGGWDQDSGNEFEGQHSMVIGGYNQLVRGLLQEPYMMDVRLNHTIQKVEYKLDDELRAANEPTGRVICADGNRFEADHIISTVPLGVLKYGDIGFDPPLPAWKMDTLRRLGFGVLNKVCISSRFLLLVLFATNNTELRDRFKAFTFLYSNNQFDTISFDSAKGMPANILLQIVLVFPECFWPPDRDMFGLCNQTPPFPDSLQQSHYSRNRGRFFLFWNCLKSSGRPVLVALLAGDAALDTEACGPASPHRTPTSLQDHKAFSSFAARSSSSGGSTPTSAMPSPDSTEAGLIASCTSALQTMFRLPGAPKPSEAIITRWRSDPFARGVYSYLGVDARPGDYENMAKATGNLHWAGEATCGTHPATVHGAFISGLRAAGEVVERMVGSIDTSGAIPSW